MKTVSDETIRKRVLRTGDGTHRYSEKLDVNANVTAPRDVDHFWGYGEMKLFLFVMHVHKFLFATDDKDLLDEDKDGINVLHPKYDGKKL